MLEIDKCSSRVSYRIFVLGGGEEIFYTMFKDNPPKKPKLNDALDMKASYLHASKSGEGG